jgi:threonine dehydratase
MELPRLSDLVVAQQRLEHVRIATPVLPVDPLIAGADDVLMKCENLQRTGSFKIRGAYNCIASLSLEARRAGVVAYSSGNHAQGVACAARLLGVAATLVMPENAVPTKIAATRRYGAAILFAGTDSETRRRVAEELARTQGASLVPPYDHPEVIAGQGTIGLEILEAQPDVSTIIVPVGGGGLIAGVALAVKLSGSRARVVGAEPVGAADAAASWRSGEIIEWSSVDTVADGLRARRIGKLPFAAISQYVDDVVSVADSAILDVVRTLLVNAHLLVEPSGAVALAAALTGARRGRTVAILSGGNIDASLLEAIASGST